MYLRFFSRGFILLELEMTGFLPIIFRLFFRQAGFAHYLRMFSRNKGRWNFAGPNYCQEILFDQCRLYHSLFQLSFASILYD